MLATARKDFEPASFDPNADLLTLLDGLTVLALVGIVDPPRPTAKDAIATAHAAGITVRMITGDHAVTAAAIASKLGITGRAITGAEFAAMSDDELLEQIDDIGVIARVTPEDKVRLVDTLKRKGRIVAMTGDGVNDAPALKRADIGIAMGITGTEVSKEAAAMILTDDNFATIVKAVELGRGLYDNLTKYIRFQMGVLFGMVVTFLGVAIGNVVGGVAFVPLQTLWINFTTQVFQAIGLGYGEPAEGLMKRKPRDPDEQILPRACCSGSRSSGVVMGLTTIGVLAWADDNYTDGPRPHDGDDVVRDREPLLLVLRARRAGLGVQPRRPARPEVPDVLGDVGARDHPRTAARPPEPDPQHDAAHAPPVADLHRPRTRSGRRDRDPEGRAPPQADGRIADRRVRDSRSRRQGRRGDR